jgi:hypothetical protein
MSRGRSHLDIQIKMENLNILREHSIKMENLNILREHSIKMENLNILREHSMIIPAKVSSFWCCGF